MTQGWGKPGGAAGRLVGGGLDPRGAHGCPIHSHLLLCMSGPLWLPLVSPTKIWGEIISPLASACLKVMNQELDSQRLDMTQERETTLRPWRPEAVGPPSLVAGTLMLSSSFSRCSSCFSSSATRIMFSFSRSRSFSVSCRTGRAGLGLALKPGHSAQLEPQSGPGPQGRLAWQVPYIVAPVGPGSETM